MIYNYNSLDLPVEMFTLNYCLMAVKIYVRNKLLMYASYFVNYACEHNFVREFLNTT